MSRQKVFSFLLLLFGNLVFNAIACRLVLEYNANFIVSEVEEGFTGPQLPDCLRVERNEIDEPMYISEGIRGNSSNGYVSAKLNALGDCIHFYLLLPLSKYRFEKWEPSVESEFILECSNETIQFTHLLLIKDENLYAPKFNSEKYNGILRHSSAHGYELKMNESDDLSSSGGKTAMQTGIYITDYDFNAKNADVTLECSGSGCNYFKFECINGEFHQGYHFTVDVQLNFKALVYKEDDLDNQVLTMSLIASDSVKSSTANFNIYVNFEDLENRAEPPSESLPSSFPMMAVGIATAVTMLVLAACTATLSYYVIRHRRNKNIVRKLTEAEIREFLEGTASLSGDPGKRSVDVNTPIMQLPYNRAFEIPRERLRIDETTILGTGAFGVVWKGSVVFSNGDGITVAVKSIKRNVGVLYFKALLSELKIMAYIGKHPNIVSLVGACTHNIRKREVYIATQYCANGNFHNYLKYRRDRFTNLVIDGELQYTNTAAYSYSPQAPFFKSISTMDLLRWATQIANGMQYLESLGIIHGDLATRNILLDTDRIAKIADFGLSRRLIDYSSDYYTKTTQAPLPWKWMAPESLRDMKFSKNSDIWSFGIVLWEIFTLAQTPYPGLSWDEGFVDRLEHGMRPKRPCNATFLLYDIMTDCWNLEPHDRPNILDVKRALEDITNTTLRQQTECSYMRFLGEQQVITLLNEDREGYLLPIDPDGVDYVDT